MASVSVYLNFNGNTEEVFEFYKEVFGTEYDGDGIMRMGDVPPQDGVPPLKDEEKNLVMHVTLPILANFMLMGSDVPESMAMPPATHGTGMYINLEPDTRAELDELFGKLSAGGKVEMEPQVMFWGDYFAQCMDKFGVQWMFNTASKE